MPPMVPMLHGPEGRTSRLPGHLTLTEGRTRAWPSFLADEGAPQPARHKRLHLASLQAPISSPAAVNVARGPPGRTWPANMHATGRRSRGSSNRLDPSDSCCCRKEHRKKVRFIRPRQSQAEQGDQRNYGELPYFGVQSLLSPLPRAQVSFELNEP
jgi:hypothetical protein